jgi:phage terminase large subunit-like protein
LRRLTPETSYGYAVIVFAALVLGEPLDPWQQWLVIHLGELLPDGRPRFRQVLVVVARQQGKTHLCKVLSLFWLFVEKWPMVFGTSTNLEQAAESWQAAVDMAKECEPLAGQLPRNAVRLANGQQTFRTVHRTVYKIGAVNRKGGRGKSIDRMIGDELREHQSWDGYLAAFGAMNARPYGQAVFITNQGDAKSVVLTSLRDNALAYATTGEGDERLGIFEWSAPEGTHPMDVHGWAAAMPQLGRRTDYDSVRSLALRVSKPGADPEELAGFLTEYLCMAVPSLKPALSPVAWARGRVPAPLDLEQRGALAACLDVSPDLQHATLAVGAYDGAKVRGELVHAWSGPDALTALRAELPEWIARVRPAVLGWFPGGPAAALDADLRDRRKEGRRGWPPAGVRMVEITTDAAAVCMGFASALDANLFLHSGQELLDEQARQATTRAQGPDRWVFARGGDAHCDSVYAVAGVVHLVRTQPKRRRVNPGVRVAPGG